MAFKKVKHIPDRSPYNTTHRTTTILLFSLLQRSPINTRRKRAKVYANCQTMTAPKLISNLFDLTQLIRLSYDWSCTINLVADSHSHSDGVAVHLHFIAAITLLVAVIGHVFVLQRSGKEALRALLEIWEAFTRTQFPRTYSFCLDIFVH